MGTYSAPKRRIHREFLYLNHETIINSLSALEAGKVDEIIQKVNEAREGGIHATVDVGPAKGGGGKKRSATMEEELVKTRTWFSAFDAWYRHLEGEEAIGTFDTWDREVRDALQVGDTIEFEAELALSPVHKVLRSFIAFSKEAGRQGSPFQQKAQELKETKATARMMASWMGGKDEPTHLPVYLQPYGIQDPRIIARLEDEYLIGNSESMEGEFKVVAQVSALLEDEEVVSAIRLVRDVPPTQVEIATIQAGLLNLVEPAAELGVTFGEEDINVGTPAVVLHPIAIYR